MLNDKIRIVLTGGIILEYFVVGEYEFLKNLQIKASRFENALNLTRYRLKLA